MNIFKLLLKGNQRIAQLQERNKIYEEQIAKQESYIKELEKQNIGYQGDIRVLVNENTQFRGSNIYLTNELEKRKQEHQPSEVIEKRNGLYNVMYNTAQALQSYRVTGYDFQGNPQIEPLVDDVARVLGQDILENCLKEIKKSI